MFSIGEGISNLIYNRITHFFDGLTRKHYSEDFIEDYIRAYPDGHLFDILGRRIGCMEASIEEDRRCFLSHQKFYTFTTQFVYGKAIGDIGCGSGYGSKILKESGADKVFGTDISKHAISYARLRYGRYARYSIQTCTDLKSYRDDSFDVTVCSEVLEHLKEYSIKDIALEEMGRVTKRNGIIILGTPNCEVLGEHGFYFHELSSLMERHFHSFVIFENALIDYRPDSRKKWEERLSSGKTGVIISENIDLSVTVLSPNFEESDTLLKKGIPVGAYRLKNIDINTRLLHNTHSFVVVIVNDKKARSV